jgi:hypothetical protein
MSAASPLPIEARRKIRSRLWEILLRAPAKDEAEKWETEPGTKPPEGNEASARGPPEDGDAAHRIRMEP